MREYKVILRAMIQDMERQLPESHDVQTALAAAMDAMDRFLRFQKRPLPSSTTRDTV